MESFINIIALALVVTNAFILLVGFGLLIFICIELIKD